MNWYIAVTGHLGGPLPVQDLLEQGIMEVVNTFTELKLYARAYEPSATVDCSDHLIHALVLQLTSNLEPFFIVEGVEAQLPSPWMSEASMQILDCFCKLAPWPYSHLGLLD